MTPSPLELVGMICAVIGLNIGCFYLLEALPMPPGLLAVTRAAGVGLNVWTVDDPGQVARLEAMGVDGICSNDPRILNRPD